MYYFGPSDIDRDGVSKWDAHNVGELKWDENFDLSPPENQLWAYNFCEKTKNFEQVLDQEVMCFLPDFRNFILSKS